MKILTILIFTVFTLCGCFPHKFQVDTNKSQLIPKEFAIKYLTEKTKDIDWDMKCVYHEDGIGLRWYEDLFYFDVWHDDRNPPKYSFDEVEVLNYSNKILVRKKYKHLRPSSNSMMQCMASEGRIPDSEKRKINEALRSLGIVQR